MINQKHTLELKINTIFFFNFDENQTNAFLYKPWNSIENKKIISLMIA